MRCKNCGSEIKEDSKFCENCGAAVERTKLSYVKCPVCGAAVPKGNTFCTNCGTSLAGKGSGNTQVNKQNKKTADNKNIIIVICIIAGALVICLAAFAAVYSVYFSGSTGRYEEAEETEEYSLEDITEKIEEEASKSSVNEEEISSITENYNAVVSSMSSGAYDKINVSEDILAYYSGDDLKAVVVSAGAGGSAYIRSYYYGGDSLFCAYYEGNDAQRFYFSNGSLIRQRYYPDSSNLSNYTDYDKGASENNTWENTVLSEAENLKAGWEEALESLNEQEAQEQEEEIPEEAPVPEENSNVYYRSDFEAALMSYCANICRAVNAGNYGIAEGNILPGSSLESSQRSLVSRLYENGTKETFEGCVLNDYYVEGNVCYMYVTETETITYSSGSSETKSYNWKYTAVLRDGSWLFSDIEGV